MHGHKDSTESTQVFKLLTILKQTLMSPGPQCEPTVIGVITLSVNFSHCF